MKHAFLLSVVAVAAVILLSLLSADRLCSPAPTLSAALQEDKSITFTAIEGTSIVHTNLEEYLPGVLAGEMPALFETQALMAQAVAARTYILHRMQHPSAAHPEADICDDPACCKAYATEAVLRENWGTNYDTYWSRITNAAKDTNGLYLTYEDAPIEAVFHSSSKGATEASEAIWNHRP